MTARAPVLAWVIAALAGIVLAGCGHEPDPNSLYPLAPGLSWKYRVTTTHTRAANTQTWRIFQNIDRVYFAGEDGVTVRRNGDGIRYWDVERDDGFYRIAYKTLADDAPIMGQSALKILPLPAKTGAKWREPAHIFLLEKANTFMSAHVSGNTIVLHYRIQSTDAKVHVPAGSFAHCVLAVGRMTFHLGAKAGFAASAVPIVQKEWYCRGVGLTKLSRDERLTNKKKTIVGGHMALSLVSGPG